MNRSKRVTFRTIAWSTKWNASHKLLVLALMVLIRAFKPDLIKLTEVPRLHKALVEVSRRTDYQLLHDTKDPGRAECAMLVHQDVKVRAWGVKKLTKLRLRTGRDSTLYALHAFLEKEEKTVHAWQAHMPAKVQLGRFWRNGWAKVVYWSALKGYGRKVRRRSGGKLVSADWNFHLGLAPIQQRLNKTFPGLKLAAKKLQGTHHSRPIDGTLTNLEVINGGTKVVTLSSRLRKIFDHKPTVTDTYL